MGHIDRIDISPEVPQSDYVGISYPNFLVISYLFYNISHNTIPQFSFICLVTYFRCSGLIEISINRYCVLPCQKNISYSKSPTAAERFDRNFSKNSFKIFKMNPFRPNPGQSFRIRLNMDRVPGEEERNIQPSTDERRITQIPPIQLRIDHQRDVNRFMINMRVMLHRRRTELNMGGGDSIGVWNWREPPMPSGLIGEGDCDGGGYGNYAGDYHPPLRGLPPNP